MMMKHPLSFTVSNLLYDLDQILRSLWHRKAETEIDMFLGKLLYSSVQTVYAFYTYGHKKKHNT